MAGIDSDLPLQPAVDDFLLYLPDPFALGIERCDLVFDFDERKTGETLLAKLGQHVLELRDMRIEQRGAFVQMTRGLGRAEVVHEHQACGEVGILAHRLAKQFTQRAGQHLSA